MRKASSRRVVLAAMAAASLMAVPAFGQLRANQDGHATDASNYVGSGGYNNQAASPGATPNDIAYRNVTGLSYFHGPIESDPRAFTGPTGENVNSNFVRVSTGAPTAYQPSLAGNLAIPYFGDNRAVAPPIGTIANGFNGGYVGTAFTPTGNAAYTLDNSAALDLPRQRLGQSDVLGVHTTLIDPQTGQLTSELNGPLAADLAANNYTGSPLFGTQNPNQDVPGTDETLPLYAPPSLANGGVDRLRLQKSDIQRMRTELADPALQQQLLDQQQNPNQNGTQGQGQGNQPSSLNQPLEGPANARTNAQINAQLGNGPLQNSVNAQENQQNRLTFPSAGQQSATYRQLQERMKQYYNPRYQQMLQNAQVQNDLMRQRAKLNTKNAGGQGPTSRPSSGFNSGPTLPSPSAPNFQPVNVKSLADGVTAKGLHDLLASAEALMRDGKFESAIAKYNTAQQVAPNNGLIPLGRANAELGAGYYQQASQDLHRVFEADPALLMGQYELKNWMNAERLQEITDELKQLDVADTKQEMPAFLLAYISYNTGQEEKAARYLAQAAERANGKDPLLDDLRTNWRLPNASAAPAPAPQAPSDLNK